MKETVLKSVKEKNKAGLLRVDLSTVFANTLDDKNFLQLVSVAKSPFALEIGNLSMQIGCDISLRPSALPLVQTLGVGKGRLLKEGRGSSRHTS